MALKLELAPRNWIDVVDFADASLQYQAYRDYYGYGASEMPGGDIKDTFTLKIVAHVSYNGRVWEGRRGTSNGKEIII